MENWKNLFKIQDYRSEELKNKAASWNMAYSKDDTLGLEQQLSQFSLLKEGSHKISNILSEADSLANTFIFDNSQTVVAGNTIIHYKQSVCFISSTQLSLPHFIMEPEKFHHKILHWLGFKDIDFDDHPQFSDKYELRGEYKTVIEFFFDKKMLDFLASHPEIHMEGMNYYFIIYSKNNLYSPAQIMTLKKLAQMIFQLFLVKSKESLSIFDPIGT